MSDKKPKRWSSKAKAEKREKPAAAREAPPETGEAMIDEKPAYARKKAPFYKHPTS
jgi:hypothetical protein